MATPNDKVINYHSAFDGFSESPFSFSSLNYFYPEQFNNQLVMEYITENCLGSHIKAYSITELKLILASHFEIKDYNYILKQPVFNEIDEPTFYLGDVYITEDYLMN